MGRLQFCRLMFDAYSISTLGSHLATTNKKIRIGYVQLKSADVRTLFSGRNSENSLTPVHTRAHQCTPTHSRIHTHLPTQAHTCKNLHKPTRTHANLHLPPHMPAHTRTYQRTPAHTHAYSHTLHIYTLNLINQIKLHVNRPNTKKTRKEDRKKMEQESTEAISGLKILFISNIMLT